MQLGERPELLGNSQGEWFGNIIPPAPSRIRSVWASIWAVRTLVADDAIDAIL
jgi:hypothetical protein